MKYREWRALQEQQSAPRPAGAPHTAQGPWWTRPDNPQPGDPWWLHHAAKQRARAVRKTCWTSGSHSKLIVAIFLMCAGAALFFDNIGLLKIWDVWAYWPLILVAMGIVRIAESRSQVVSGIVLVFVGIALLGGKLGLVFASADVLWPLILVGIGVGALLKAMDSRRHPPAADFVTPPRTPPPPPPYAPPQAPFGASQRPFENARRPFTNPFGRPEPSAQVFVIFGSLKRVISSFDFRRCEALSLFGEVNLDLTHAQISPRQGRAVLEANAIFGAVNVRVPPDWRIQVRGAGVFGGYEDKTIPPRPAPDFVPPELIITGAAVFGGVVVRN
jgi:hypothetical protein